MLKKTSDFSCILDPTGLAKVSSNFKCVMELQRGRVVHVAVVVYIQRGSHCQGLRSGKSNSTCKEYTGIQ